MKEKEAIAGNTGFILRGVTYKFGALCFYLTSILLTVNYCETYLNVKFNTVTRYCKNETNEY